MKRYEQFAEQMAGLIRSGVMPPGQKLPSVRQAARTHGVSLSTVFEAYYLLESRGLITARARSGYYVRETAPHPLPEPGPAAPPAPTSDVDVSELVFSVFGSLKDPDIVPFGSAFPSPELFPLARLARSMSHALHRLAPDTIIAEMTEGNAELRRQIALRSAGFGIRRPPEELVITSGAMEALNLCLQCLTQPGDLVAIEAPAFYASLQVLERLKLKAVEIPVHPREGIDLDYLEDCLQRLPIKACWFMSSLQNPLGASLSDERKQALYALLVRYRLPMIEDDVYAELYFGDRPPRPVKSLDSEGLVMHCGSFSKCLAPGYRIGWVSGGRYSEVIQRLKLMTTISPSIPAQAAIADYLQHGGYDRHLRKLRHELESRQSSMLASAARHFPEGTRVTRPAGGYLLWFEFPDGVDSLQLCRQAMAQGISLAPGPIFSATRRFRHCARLNSGHRWDERKEQAMTTLGVLLRQP